MTDQNNRQIKPKFSKGNVVYYCGKGNIDKTLPLIVLLHYIFLRKNTYKLLFGDTMRIAYEHELSIRPITQTQKT